MISAKDIYASAQSLIKQHYAGAEDYATDMMHEFLVRDDAKEAGTWLAISEAIRKLRQITPQGAVH